MALAGKKGRMIYNLENRGQGRQDRKAAQNKRDEKRYSPLRDDRKGEVYFAIQSEELGYGFVAPYSKLLRSPTGYSQLRGEADKEKSNAK